MSLAWGLLWLTALPNDLYNLLLAVAVFQIGVAYIVAQLLNRPIVQDEDSPAERLRGR